MTLQSKFMWAAIAEDRPGEENGIVSIYHQPTRSWMPLVCFYERNVEGLRKSAKKIANDSGRKIRVHKFMHVEEE